MKPIREVIEAMINAPTCYSELKNAGQEYLDSIGKENEKEVAKKLIAETEADIELIDDVLQFFESDKGKAFFGEDQAAALAKKAREVKAAGGKYCFCPACTAGLELLERKDEIL